MSCTSGSGEMAEANVDQQPQQAAKDLRGFSKAYFASGCFWCVEAVFESVKGVEEVISGYSGGEIENPTYRQVSSGQTKHAEAVEVYYDPELIDYQTLLVVFFDSHDPTTLNRQGPDRGPQYRSMILYQNDTEKQLAEAYITQLESSGVYNDPIVTEVVPFEVFYEAEDYHQDYERRNPNQSYIQAVSIPRLKRFQKKHPELLKEGGH
ncbi:MAG: peptide-methionine (S)-S-oxide reductase MsrA [Bacteroidetes bacterium]|nr:peptide-methionine (S)-S-oxide reductase MsrA [Bacteroidota bacterium]